MKIEKTIFDGLDVVLLETTGFCLMVTTGVGPRIAWFGKPDGDNLLYWDKNGMERGGWKLYGGHRVWISRPLGDEAEDTYLPDNDPCAITMLADGVDLCAPASPVSHLARGMEIRMRNETSLWVRGYLRNEGPLISSGGCWMPTCVVADKPIEIPLGSADPLCSWDIVQITIPRVFAGNTATLEDDQVELLGNTLRLTPKGRVCKRAVRAPQGTIRLLCDGYAFQKTSLFNPCFSYPLNGCNLAAFIGPDNFMAEMESFGHEQAIVPGQTIENVEIWELL